MSKKCKNCEFYIGNCGHHFVDLNRHCNYEIASKSSLDKFGDCSFFRLKEELMIDKRRCIIAVEESNIINPCKSWIIQMIRSAKVD